ncbi:MAG: RagB/SusD family nutrient uptake outer membrane protein [Breznakibacter sp.]
MKKIIYSMVGLSLLTASCEDYLNVEAPSAFETDYVFANANESKKAVMAVYALFTQDPYTSRMSNAWMQNTDVEAIAPGAAPDGTRRDVWSLQAGLLTGFGDIYSAWNNNYLAIDRASQCIEGILNSPEAQTADMKMLLGEAYCLRAYRYFLLCNFWGDVPYFTEAAKSGMQLDVPKTDKNYIYSGSIQDLVTCEGDMYFADQFSDGIERMNREFAIGMIARLALFRAGYGMTESGTMKIADEYLDVANDDKLAVTYTDVNGATKVARTSSEYYELAKNYCQKLISLRGRELNPDYRLVFENESKWVKPTNDDVLYEIAFGDANSGGDVGWCIGIAVTGGTRGTTTIQVNMCPAYYYSFDDEDVRRDVCVSRVSYTSNSAQAASGFTGLATGKWNRLLLPSAAVSGETSSKGTGINWPLMRYSDVLLMLAEAENELNGPSALAQENLAKVRRRAFPSSVHAEKVDAYIGNVSASKEDFREAIVAERAWEFGGECIRRFDLVRWNKYGERIVKTKNMLDNIGKAAWGIDIENPEVAQYGNYAPILYYQRTDGVITFLNVKYKPVTVPDNVVAADKLDEAGNEDAYASVNYGKALYQEIKNATTGEVTHASANYTTYCWRGYTDPTGVAPVPYLLPISSTTVGASEYLTNEGYGHVFSAN